MRIDESGATSRGAPVPRRLSVVMPNYNYGAFLRAGVDSALAIDWPDVEVIVVDDGSTDDSLQILESYGDRIQVIRQANSGPRVACNRGFARSSGEIVMFLDSDDLVRREVGDALEQALAPGVSKVQIQMQRVDQFGNMVGRAFPRYRTEPTPEQVRKWFRATAAYPTPPGSGNVYSRWFLERIFPLGDECGDATDSACLAAAPLLGDVRTLAVPLVGYRVHGRNRSYLLADTARFTSQIVRALQRHEFAQRLDHRRDDEHWLKPLRRGTHLLELRVSNHRVTGVVVPPLNDGFGQLLRDVVRSAVAPGPDGLRLRAAHALWCVVTLVAPASVARRLVAARFKQRTSLGTQGYLEADLADLLR